MERSPEEKLWNAVLARDLAGVNNAINTKKINLNMLHEYKGNSYTALFLAVTMRDKHTINLLLNAGADPDIDDEYGWSPLHWVSYHGYLETVKALLKPKNSTPYENVLESRRKVANVNVKDIDGSTPLLFAVSRGHVDIVHELLEHGADPTIANDQGDRALDFTTRLGLTWEEEPDPKWTVIRNMLLQRLRRGPPASAKIPQNIDTDMVPKVLQSWF
jgi:ankyrin repeat protein